VPDECDLSAELVVVNDRPAVHGYTEISSSGTALNLGDDDCATVTMPFTTPVFVSGTVRVSNNGGIGFNTTATLDWTNGTVPGGAFGGAQALLPYWDDLYYTTGNVYVQTVGITPNRIFIAEWYNRPHYPGDSVLDGDEATFQLQVFETPVSGIAAQFLYTDTDFLDPSLNNGASATVGYQRDGTTGSQWSCNTAGAVQAGVVLSLVNSGTSADCNNNRVPDECDIADGTSQDLNGNGIPDECELP